ncbi:MAG: Gfo/Idh/MocA family protein [Planctomycetota bacterium]|jgi:predicted dehydrogenase
MLKKKIKTGIIGLGAMGQGHLKTLLADVENCEVTAVCDIDEKRFSEAKEKELLSDSVKTFTSGRELIDSALCEAVVIVTPHPSHPELTIYALEKGLHTLCDKPIASDISDADEMVAAWQKTGLIFSTMHSMRTTSANKVIKEWLDSGRLGDVRRVDMVSSVWLRTQTYYNEQSWRGTWQGEGGGLLLNQAPHNLDLLYWWFGEAESVNAEMSNRFHDIETEDEVNAVINSKAGFPIRFYATTAEAPGIDRVEIVGTAGTLIRDSRTADKLIFRKLAEDLDIAVRKSEERMLAMEFEDVGVEVPEAERGHKVVFRNFFDTIINNSGNSNLISPADEGIHSLEWANAMILSSIEEKRITLPLNRQQYKEIIKSLICEEELI